MKPSEVARAVRLCIDAGQPCIVWGGPGIGKSQVSKQVSDQMGRTHFDIRACLLDPVDLRGIPSVEDGRTRWNQPSFLPDGSSGPSVILLDELNRAPVMTQNGLFQLVLDRKLGEYTMPADCSLIACCNRASDGGGVQQMPAALLNRFVHFEMEPDLDDWCRWAVIERIEPSVIAFLRFRPALLHQFDRKEKAFASPRSWEFVSRLTRAGSGTPIEHDLYCGAVGKGPAVEYSAFLELFRKLPNIDAILLDPGNAPVPKDPGTLFAVASALAARMTDQTQERCIQYADRMPAEYSVYMMKDAVWRDRTLTATPAFNKWTVKNADVLF